MTMSTQYVAYDLGLPGSVRITQLSDPNPKFGARPIHEKVTGSPYGSFTGVGEANPDFTFATKDLFTLVTALVAAYASSATNGYLLAPFTGNGDVGYQKMKAGSTREAPASTVHRVHRYPIRCCTCRAFRPSRMATPRRVCECVRDRAMA